MFLCAQLYAKEGLFERHHHLTTAFLDPYLLAVVHLLGFKRDVSYWCIQRRMYEV